MFFKGVEDYTLSANLYPQDFRLLGFALGSIASAGSPSPYQHTLKELDNDRFPFPSLQVEIAQRGQLIDASGVNFVRTVDGLVVNTLTITASEGEPLAMDAEFIGQDLTYSSGAPTANTENTDRPFISSDCTVQIPSGTSVVGVNSCALTINNNFRAPHHINGTNLIDTPISQNRDYEVALTLDGNQAQNKTFYDQYFLGGSTFNMQIRYNASAGSRDAVLVFSGCKMMDMDAPTTNENVQAHTLTIQPETCSAVVADTIEVYGF